MAIHHRNEISEANEKSVVGQAKEKAAPVVEQVQDKAKEATAQVQTRAKDITEERKSQAAGEVAKVAQAVRTTSREMRNQDQENVAHYTEIVADQIEQVSHYLDERDINHLLNDAADFARRRPEIFLGGAFMVGLALGRFLTSSSGQAHHYAPNRYQGGDINEQPSVDYGSDSRRFNRNMTTFDRTY